MRELAPILLILCALAFCTMVACPPETPPKNACESINIPSVGPGTGSTMVCVLPSECREDIMTTKIDSTLCNDKSLVYCPAGNAACSNACVGSVVSSGLKATSCSWDRNSECHIEGTDGGTGGNCTCAWTIPAGSSLSCGCGCK